MLDKNTKKLLPQMMQDTMDALSILTNAPDEMTLPITLAVANFAAQAHHNVDPIQWKSCAISEFFIVLVPSGGMKTSISDMLLQGVKRFERDQEPEAKQARTDYKIAVRQFNKAVEEEAKNPTGVKIIQPEKPRGDRYLVEKATVNGIINTLDSVPFAGLFNSDAGEFFSSHSFQDSNKSIEMVATLSKAWSGEDLNRTTGIEDNNVKLHDRRFSMLMLLQQQLAGFLNNADYKDQGFTNRMLITQSAVFSKPLGDFSAAGRAKLTAAQKILDPFNDRIEKLLNKVESLQAKARTASMLLPGMTTLEKLQAQAAAAANAARNPNELILDNIKFDDDAMQIMEDFYNKMNVDAMNPKYEEYSNFMLRAYEHCVRLAATLAIFDLQDTICKQYAECAVGLMNYFIDQRMNLEVDGSVRTSAIVEAGEKLIKWLKKELGQEATKSRMLQYGPNAFKKMEPDGRTKVITDLLSRELIEVLEVPGSGAKHVTMIKLTDLGKK